MSMKKLVKKIVATALVCAMALTAAVGLTSCKKDDAGSNVVKIGFSGPLTGDAAVYGIAVRNSAQLAVDEINAYENANGNPLGVTFQLMSTDDKHDATLVESNYASMFEDGMQISLGTVTTGPGLEFKEMAKEDNVFFITPSASGDAIPEYDNAYQMCFADSNQGTASANYFNENYAGKTIGIFFKSDDEYSVGIKNKFLESLDSAFTVKQASFKGQESNFSSQVQELKDCDVIFMPIYYTPASQFMVQAKNDVKANAIYFGCDGLDGVKALLNSTVTASVRYITPFDATSTDPMVAEFVEAYKAKYDGEIPTQFAADAYDAIMIIYSAIMTCNIDPTQSVSALTEALKAALTGGEFTYSGLTGENMTWTADGKVKKPMQIVTVQ